MNVKLLTPWRIFKIGSQYISEIKHYWQGDFQNATTETRVHAASEVRRIASMAAMSTAPIPIPFSDLWTITPIQIAMVQAIANIYGHKLNRQALLAACATLAGSWLSRQATLAVVKLGLPLIGGWVNTALVYAWTQALGKTAEKYFASNMQMSAGEIDHVREREFEAARVEKAA